MNKVNPEQSSELSNNESDDKSLISASARLSSKPPISVKTCLIALILVSVIMSVSILSIIWVTFFSATLSDLSESVLKMQQNKLVAYTDQILYQFVLTSETAKKHISLKFTNTTDMLLAENSIVPTYISEKEYHGSLIEDVSLITYAGNGVGVLWNAGRYLKFTYSPKGVVGGPCEMKETVCNTLFLLYLPPFDHSIAKKTIAKRVGKPIYTPTYTSTSAPITFFSLVNSNTNSSAPNGYDWFIMFSMSTTSLSNFLKNSTSEISGSIGFIMETSSNYLVATNYPEERPAVGTIAIRTNGTTNNNTNIRNLYSLLESNLPNFKDEIKCNNFQILQLLDYKMSVYRYCSDYNIDWFIVFAVPQWNYIGNMIIAIICALASGVLVIVVGAVLGVYSSLKIVKPFQNLIELFGSVSRMELDVEIVESKFKEVFLLQQNFKLMVSKIKQYRAFIPAHLLSQLDNSKDEAQQELGKVDEKESDRKSFAESSRFSKHSDLSHQQSYRPVSNMLFKLGLEKKKVSFCMLYLDGFDHLLQSMDNTELVTVFSEMFELIQKLNGAQIGNYENQSLVISWNSTTEVKDHEKKALSSSFQVYEKLEQLLKKWKTKSINDGNLFDKFLFIMAIHKQECKCGNVGTNSSKSFTIVGSVSNNLSVLIKHAKKMKIGIVASESIISKCNSNMTRFIGEKKLLNEHSTALPLLSDKEKKTHERIYQVGEPNTASMDVDKEWMYELQESERKNKWGEYNKAIKLLDEKQPLQCLNILRDFESKNPNDEPTKYLIKKCNKLLEK